MPSANVSDWVSSKILVDDVDDDGDVTPVAFRACGCDHHILATKRGLLQADQKVFFRFDTQFNCFEADH